MDFKIPEGYENFVTNAEDLKQQVKNNENSDNVCFEVYTTTPLCLERALKLRSDILLVLFDKIRGYLWQKGSFSLHVVINELSGLVFLRGSIDYAENVDDEWYTVYMLLELSKWSSELIIAVRDTSDGQFLLIESCDHLDDWVQPDNSENRVWLHSGQMYIIPLDEPGRTREGHMFLTSALEFMSSSRRHIAVVNKKVHNAIALRSLDVYPAKICALDHYVTCVLPTWAAAIFAQYPNLVPYAVSAFCATEKFGSTNTSKAKRASNIDQKQPTDSISTTYEGIRSSQISILRVRFTRILYAQLTFKPGFRPPRQYHSFMRRATDAGSVKVQKAFDVGVRLLCGLDAVYKKSIEAEKRVRELRLQHSDVIAADRQKLCAISETQKTSLPLNAIESLHREGLLRLQHESDDSVEEEGSPYDEIEEMYQLLRQYHHCKSCFQPDEEEEEKRTSVDTATVQSPLLSTMYIHEALDSVCQYLSSPGYNSRNLSGLVRTLGTFNEIHSIDSDSFAARQEERAFFSCLSSGSEPTLRSDTEDWLHMRPEEMEEEMSSRMRYFNQQQQQQGQENTTGGGDTIKTEDAVSDIEKKLSNLSVKPGDTDSINATPAVVASSTNNSEDMQGLVDGIKSFLRGKSDYDGIGASSTTGKKKGSNSGDEAKCPSAVTPPQTKEKKSVSNVSNSISILPTHEIAASTGDNSSAGLSVDMELLQRILDSQQAATTTTTMPSSNTIPTAAAIPTNTATENVSGVDENYLNELQDLQRYFSKEDLEQFSSDDDDDDDNSDSEVEDDSDDTADNRGIRKGHVSVVSPSQSRQQQQESQQQPVPPSLTQTNVDTTTGVGSFILSSQLTTPSKSISSNRLTAIASPSAPHDVNTWSDDDNSSVDSDDQSEEGGSGDEIDSDDDEGGDETAFMKEYQNMMDEQLFGADSTMKQTFQHTMSRPSGNSVNNTSKHHRDTATAEGDEETEHEVHGLDDVDIDLHLLTNLLESHSQALGMPIGPASSLLSQFGLSLPVPPPMSNSEESGNSGKSRK